MSAQQGATSSRQVIVPIPSSDGSDWTEFEVRSFNRENELDIRTIVKSSSKWTFLDLSIEEYTGQTRRAKYTCVRLEEEAARKLYDLLALKFRDAA